MDSPAFYSERKKTSNPHFVLPKSGLSLGLEDTNRLPAPKLEHVFKFMS